MENELYELKVTIETAGGTTEASVIYNGSPNALMSAIQEVGEQHLDNLKMKDEK